TATTPQFSPLSLHDALPICPLERTYVEEVVRELGAALGVVGLLNVQLAIADSELYVLEVNPRASRTVPFASKASGINLVAAACRDRKSTRLNSSHQIISYAV